MMNKKYTHNLTLDNLIKTFKLGGIVCPSIAYSNQDMNFFGDVELVFHEDFFKEKGGDKYKNFVYAYRIDAYTGVLSKNITDKEELYKILSKQLIQNTEKETQGDEIDLFLANSQNNPRIYKVEEIENLKFITREERIDEISNIQLKYNIKTVEDLKKQPNAILELNQVNSDYAELKLDVLLNYHDKEQIQKAIKEVNLKEFSELYKEKVEFIKKIFALYDIEVFVNKQEYHL